MTGHAKPWRALFIRKMALDRITENPGITTPELAPLLCPHITSNIYQVLRDLQKAGHIERINPGIKPAKWTAKNRN